MVARIIPALLKRNTHMSNAEDSAQSNTFYPDHPAYGDKAGKCFAPDGTLVELDTKPAKQDLMSLLKDAKPEDLAALSDALNSVAAPAAPVAPEGSVL